MAIVTIQPGMRGADYVFLTNTVKRWLLDNDVRFVIRYFVKPTSTQINKDIRREELDWLGANGIAVVPNFERHHNDSDGGATAAQRNATELLEVCNTFGVPPSVARIMSIDTDIYHRNIDVAEQYVRRSRAILGGPFGIYGDDDIAYRCRDIIDFYWRVNASGWDGETRQTPVTVQQYRPTPEGVDPNTAIRPFPAWLPGQPDQEDTTMLTIYDGAARIVDTRIGKGLPRGRIGAGQEVRVSVPAGADGQAATGAVVSVVALNPSTFGHVVVGGQRFGSGSAGNYQPGDTEPTATLVAVDPDTGTFGVKISHGTADLLVDLLGVLTGTVNVANTTIEAMA